MNVRTLVKTSVAAAALMAAPLAMATPLDLDNYTQCTGGLGNFGVSVDDVTDNEGSASECFGAETSPNNIGSYESLEWGGTIWSRQAKWDGANGGNLSLDTTDGLWDFLGDTSGWTSYFIVTKAGSNPGWAGYHFNMPSLGPNDDLGGTFEIPWTNNNGLPVEISHMSIYSLGGSVTVPEPGTLALFGLGLVGLGLARRKA